MKIFRTICRILVGAVFIFSGFVKGIDPLGFAFRLEDYFYAFGLPWAVPSALYLSIFLCTVEFVVGISLLFNLWIRKMSWVMMAMMTFFTVLTLFDALYNLVPDCGCFGEFIKLTNLQTFLKNLVLLIFVIPVFTSRRKYRQVVPGYFQKTVLLLFALGFAWLSVYCYRHLPVIDFMDWKVGNQVNQVTSEPVKFFVKYKNKTTGEEKEYQSPNYPWNDSAWLSNWVFVSQRTEDPNTGKALSLRIEDEKGIDVTGSFIDNPGYQFILVSWDLAKAKPDAFINVLPLYKKAYAEGAGFICITNALPSDIKKFRMANGTAFDFYFADDIIMKTMVRSNPGLVLLKNGKVIAKWHYNDFPDWETVKRRYMHPSQ